MLITARQEQNARLLAYLIVILYACNQIYFLFPFSPIIWRIAIMVLNMIAVVLGFKTGFIKTEKYILLFMLLVTGYFIWGFGEYEYGFTNIGNMYVGLFSFPAMSSLARRGALRESDFRNMVVLLTATSIIYYLNSQANTLARLGLDSTTINASVVFAMLLPSALLFRSQKLTFIFVGICIFFLLNGAKRGNILASVIPLILLMIHLFRKNRKSFWKRLAFLIVIVSASIWIYDLVLSNDYLLDRYRQTLSGNSSNRNVIYSTMWDLWSEKADFWQFLFGYGYDGSILYGGLGRYAHNDWLEILVDYGLLGAVIYGSIFIGLISIYQHIKKKVFKQVILAIMAVWFVKTCVSMGFTGETMFLLALPFAYVVGYNYIESNQIKSKKTK